MLHPQLAEALALAANEHMRRTGTAAHSQRVARLAALTALELGHSSRHAARIRVAAAVHDVGKASIPESVLLKPGPLDEHEWRLIVAHPAHAAAMLTAPALQDIAHWVFCHHERPDGSGYPHALTRTEIPPEAAIISACDAFDAITSSRPNSAPAEEAQALAELESHAGSQFDAQVVGALTAVLGSSYRFAPEAATG